MTHNTYPLHSQHSPTRPSIALVNSLFFWGEPLLVLFFAIPLMLPGLLFPEQWQAGVVIAFYGLLWLQRIIHRASIAALQLSQQATGLLLVWLPIAVATATKSTLGWQAAGYLLVSIGFYQVIVTHEWFKREPATLRWVLVGLGAILTLIAPTIVNWKSEFRLFYVSLYDLFAAIALNGGETIHANLLAGALVLVSALLLPQLLSAPETVHKLQVFDTIEGAKTLRIRHPSHSRQRLITPLLTLFFLALLAILILTQSRGGYLAFCISLGVVLLLRWPRLWLTVPFLLGGLGYSLYTVGVTSVFDLLGADNTFGGAEWRGPVWHASWQAFQDFAWTGIGIGNFQQVMPLLYPNPAITHPAATHAHNLMLQIGLDLGLPGLAAYLLLYLTMISMAIAILRRTRSPQATATALGATWEGHTLIAPAEVGVTLSTKRFIRQVVHYERTRQQHWAIAAGCLAALIGMQLHGVLDAVTWGNKLAFIPWLIFAQITILYRYHTTPYNDPAA